MKLRGGSRGKGNKETLYYLHGGFRAALERITGRLTELGVQIHTSSPVSRVVVQDGKATGIERAGFAHDSFDKVLVTVPLPTFTELVPELPQAYKSQCLGIPFLGNVCLVLRLRQSLSSTYWLNVADPTFPFVGVIEHTNLDDRSKYGGEHIAYLSKYLPTTDALYQMSDTELLDFSVPHIKRIFPQFEKSWVIGHSVWRARYSQPVVVKGYSSLIPSMKTPIANLWLSTMAQVYPEDRGTNYAVAYGRKVAAEMVAANR
jgi:protoporphyrinogen oxidase